MSLVKSTRWSAVLLTLLVAATFSVVAPESKQPVDVGAGADVEVRLITIDVLALDKEDRTIADLGPADFELTVDGKESEIETFDVDCAAGSVAEPAARSRSIDPVSVESNGTARRIVFMIDYAHLSPTPVQVDLTEPDSGKGSAPLPRLTGLVDPRLAAFDNIRAALTGGFAPGDEFMLAAIANGFRVEQPFTSDRAKLLDAVRRMQNDVTLWNGDFAHTTELSTFQALDVMFEVLGEVNGPKAVVLFSDGIWPNGCVREYDLELTRLSSMAGNSRVTIYPVIARGLGLEGEAPAPCGACAKFGVTSGLDSIAAMTGGRVTRNTSDLTLAATRAARDLSCRYTLGFYDRRPGEYRARDVRIAARRPGVRVLHPSRYSFRSPVEKHKARLTAAWMVPTMFPGGIVRAHLYPLRPQTAKLWQSRLAVEFPVALLGDHVASEPFTFGATVKTGRRIVHQFSRNVQLKSGTTPSAERLLKFVQDINLPPGKYEVTAVAEGSDGERLFTATSSLHLPEIPRDQPFIVGPTLGRSDSDAVTVHAGTRMQGKAIADDPKLDRIKTDSFAPILVTDVEKRDRIGASSMVCLLSSLAKPEPAWFERSLVLSNGEPAGTLDPIEVRWTSDEKVRCEQTLDVVPVGNLRAGDYKFEAKLISPDKQPIASSSVPFSVVPPKPGEATPEPVPSDPTK